jgi:hypothetical protein
MVLSFGTLRCDSCWHHEKLIIIIDTTSPSITDKDFAIKILALASFAVVVQRTKVAASGFSFSCMNFFSLLFPTLMCTVCNNANICWCAMELRSFKFFHTMTSSCSFGQQKCQHCQNCQHIFLLPDLFYISV